MQTPAKYLSADERRAATVEAVVQLSATGNPSDITTTTIARHMGVTQGALSEALPEQRSDFGGRHAVGGQQAALPHRPRHRRRPHPLGGAGRRSSWPMCNLPCSTQACRACCLASCSGPTTRPPKRLAQTLLREYGQRLHRLIEQAQAQGSVAADTDVQATVLLFIGSVQGLVMQALLAGDMRQMQQQAPAVYALFSRALAAPAAQSATNYKKTVRP